MRGRMSDVAKPLITSTTVSAEGKTGLDAFRLFLPFLQFIFSFITVDVNVAALLHQLIFSMIFCKRKRDIILMSFISFTYFFIAQIKKNLHQQQ